jgi:hypothetical protein
MAVYKFTLKESETRYFEFLKGVWFKGDFLAIRHGYVTIKEGYSHNGCSPKWKVGGKIIGTWDGPNGILEDASRWHDVFYQYSKNIKVKRIDVDRQFLEDMGDFPLRKEYYTAVRAFGGIGWKRGGI